MVTIQSKVESCHGKKKKRVSERARESRDEARGRERQKKR